MKKDKVFYQSKFEHYRVIVPLSYLIAHSIMWCTIWACVYLPDLTFASDGFIINIIDTVDIVSAHLEYPNYMLRWGGEEFLIILRSDLARAEKQAEKIRQAIEKETGKICPVTISIGVTGYHGGDYNASVRMADEALYEAKESGRNRVKIYNSNFLHQKIKL